MNTKMNAINWTKELNQAKPNPMINGHQDWLDGLVHAAKSFHK